MSTPPDPAVTGGQALATHTLRSRIEWIDTDAAGIYHNSTVVRLVEAAEAALAREHGLDGYFPVAPRVHYEADFEAPLFFGQEVTTTVSVIELGTTSMTFGFEVWGEEFERAPRVLAALGRYVTVHLDRGGPGRATSTPWPAAWVDRLTGRNVTACARTAPTRSAPATTPAPTPATPWSTPWSTAPATRASGDASAGLPAPRGWRRRRA